MRIERIANRLNKGGFEWTGEVLFFNAQKEVRCILAVLRPEQYGLILLVSARSVTADADTESHVCCVEFVSRERIPRPREHIDPFAIARRKRQTILNLQVQAARRAIAFDAYHNDVVEWCAEMPALTLDMSNRGRQRAARRHFA